MSAYPLIDQRKVLFYKKTACGSNIVLRTVYAVCILMRCIQRLSSTYNILPWHTSYFDVKRTFWSSLLHFSQFSFFLHCICFCTVFPCFCIPIERLFICVNVHVTVQGFWLLKLLVTKFTAKSLFLHVSALVG